MPVIESKLDPRDAMFAENRAATGGTVADLRAKVADDRAGRRRSAPARSMPRAASCCRASACARCSTRAAPFLELSQLAAYGMYDDNIAAAGIITGIGRVAGQRMRDRLQRRDGQGRHVLPDDGEEAPARAGDRARRTGCPCIYLVDSGGANLPNQDDVFPDRDHFGRIFYNQATMSARGHSADRRR